MEEKHLTKGKAVGISCIVAIGAFAAVLMLFEGYFVLVTPIFIVSEVPLIIIGALIGKYLTASQVGIWCGAALGAMLGYRPFLSILSMVMSD